MAASTATLSPHHTTTTPTRTGHLPPSSMPRPSEMDGQQPEMPRTLILSEQLATPDQAIRDFLMIPQDDADAGTNKGTSPAARDADGGGGGKINWKPLRDRLRLRRAANAWRTPPAPKVSGAATAATTNSGLINRSNKYDYSPSEAAAAFSRTFSRVPSLRTATPTFSRVSSTRVGANSSRSRSRRPAAYEHRNEVHEDDHGEDNDGGEEEEEEAKEEEDEEQGKEEAPAAQMSLMALLEQTDSWDDEDEDDAEGGGGERKHGGGTAGDDDEYDGEGREEEMVHVCCVCMVRHKGAAFIPCGHTFCRLCSRELWVRRGNCPLCNGFIQEILDIF